MLKRSITYTTFDNEPITEEFYFNITRSEVAKMELGRQHMAADGTVTGGMVKYLQEQVGSGEGAKIMATFETFIDASYGIKSPDGKRHLKTDEVLAEFKSSAAYDQLFYELCTDAKAGADFFNGIMPVDLTPDVEAARSVSPAPLSAEDFGLPETSTEPTEEEMLALFADEPKAEKDYSKLTGAELRALPRSEMIAAYRQKSREL